jgi:hypothetical protein
LENVDIKWTESLPGDINMNAVDLAAKMSYRDPSREGKLYTYLTSLGHCNAT